jgi:hypothetical protein
VSTEIYQVYNKKIDTTKKVNVQEMSRMFTVSILESIYDKMDQGMVWENSEYKVWEEETK